MIGFEEFHFLRPFWLLGLLPALGLMFKLYRHSTLSPWQTIIDDHLLPYLLTHDAKLAHSLWLMLVLALAWIAAILALAGPVWQKIPQPLEVRQDALIVMLDLSYSMLAQDVKPSRFERARFKLTDLFNQRTEGQTALLVYAGAPHVVVPFTDDTNTLHNLLAALTPAIMPVPGSRVDLALIKANALFTENQITRGRILLITDGINKVSRFYNALSDNHDLVVLGVGTQEGAPIPNPKQGQGFLRDNNGNTVIATVVHQQLGDLIRRAGGVYSALTLDESDLERVLPDHWWEKVDEKDKAQTTEREHNLFVEQGHWLVLICLPALLGLFRRGALITLALATLLLPILSLAPPAYAADMQASNSKSGVVKFWDNLWFTPEQQGYQLMQKDQPKEALKHFQRPDWRASAHYRAGNHPQAEKIWSREDTVVAHYNRGNALARQGNFQGALGAYEKALEKEKTNVDALANKGLMEKLLEQQQQSSQSDDKGDKGEQQQQSSQSDDKGDKGEQQQQSSQSDDESQQEGESPQQQAENTDDDIKKDAGEEEGDEKQIAQHQNDGDEKSDQENRDFQQLRGEQKQELQQWLRRIPEDPGGLLRRKFQYEANQQERYPTQNQEQNW